LWPFIRPPSFGGPNSKRYWHALSPILVNGDVKSIQAIAPEIGRSVASLISIARRRRREYDLENGGFSSVLPPEANVANSIVSALGDRRFCKTVATTAPWVAAELFNCASKGAGLGTIPLSQFSRNVAAEFFRNPETAIHHEDDGFRSGLLGQAKPISRELFGNFELVEALAARAGSPLEGLWFDQDKWSEESWKTYLRAASIFLESYVARSHRGMHSYAVAQLFSTLERMCSDVYRLNDDLENSYDRIERRKVSLLVDFVKRTLDLLEKEKYYAPLKNSRSPDRRYVRDDLYDYLAEVSASLLFDIASIRTTEFVNWEIQHNAVWTPLNHDWEGHRAQKIFRSRFHRLIVNEIRDMGDRWWNYKGARVISVCLNVMGLSLDDKVHRPAETRGLKRYVLTWVKKHYLQVQADLPDVARAFLSGTISFDEGSRRLVKTYSGGLSREPHKEYLENLAPPS
jgi:hypothetical protein